MLELRYATQKPTEPGWYWCRNKGDYPGQIWEAVAHVVRHLDGFHLSWMTSAGNVGILHERDWSDDTEWAGPICRPVNASEFQGRPLKR